MRSSFRKPRDKQICNVCLLHVDRLTKDHVPPSGAIDGRNPVTVRQPHRELLIGERGPTELASSSGLYFPTVCTGCHSSFSEWDEELKRFAVGLRRTRAACEQIASSVIVPCRTDYVIRSVLAHMLTSKLDIDGNVLEVKIRHAIRGSDAQAVRGLKLYYWPYRRALTYIRADFVAPLNGSLPFGSLIKFEPIAFFASECEIDSVQYLDAYDHLFTRHTSITVSLVRIVDENWPDSTGITMGGSAMIDHVVARRSV